MMCVRDGASDGGIGNFIADANDSGIGKLRKLQETRVI